MLSVICNVDFNEKSDSFQSHNSFNELLNHNHLQNVISCEFYARFVENLIKIFSKESNETCRIESLSVLIESSLEEQEITRFDLTSLAISCLQLFAHINWLGPNTSSKPNIPNSLLDENTIKSNLNYRVFCLVDYFQFYSQEFYQFQDQVRSLLQLDGETLFPIVKSTHLLLFAKLVFLDIHNKFKDIQLFNWWSLRTVYLYQQLFEERSATLTTLSNKFMEKLNKLFDSNDENNLSKVYERPVFKFASICYLLESGHVYYQNYNWSAAQACFRKAIVLSNINYELVGVYGKRTRYQQKDIAQLFLKLNKPVSNEQVQSIVEKNEALPSNWPHSNDGLDQSLMPKDFVLNDETLLEKIKITNTDDEKEIESSNSKSLSQLEQVVFYCSLFDFQKNSPVHNLTDEEMQPFINFLLSSPKNWCVQMCTLFMRTKIEFSSVKRMERSLQQLESLIDHYRQTNDKPDTSMRYQFFYCVGYQPFWTMQKELCKFYMQIGLINSSLEIYESLQIWEDVIKCYQVLEKKDRAEQLIRQQLAIKETADLYCSLGEVIREFEPYHKAIELSKGRSARAYRMLAKLHFSKNQYKEAIEYFEKSLKCNSMQYDAWFMLGSAAFRSEKWETAIQSFRTCTHLDPENYETWNNLAASYLKMKQKDKAHAVFREALKVDYENWKIWENFLWTSTDCGQFEDVIKAYHRLLDLKSKYVDVDVLRALAMNVKLEHKDASEISIFKYKEKILGLFGRINSLVPTNWMFYWYFADIVLNLAQIDDINNNISKIPLSKEAADKYFSLLFKAFRNLYNQPNWELGVDSCREVIEHSILVLEKCLEYGNYLENPDYFASLNLNLKSIITKLKNKYDVDSSGLTKYVKLVYLKDLDVEFVNLQIKYEQFVQAYFA